MAYEVRDISLAGQGKKNIEWAESQMGALMKVREEFSRTKPLEGVRVGMALHVTKETAALVRTLVAGGARVAIASCNPLSTQDDVAAALADEGVQVFAYKGESREDYYKFIRRVLDTRPQVTVDDGCDLVSTVHTERQDLIPGLLFGTEETTTGVIRLRAMEREGALKYPIFAVNDAPTKHLVDNYYGTGQSTIDGILRASNVLLAGKTFVVAGYGNCGKGVAMRARGMGANVVVTEVDPFRALQAVLDGFRVMPMAKAAEIGDVFVTVTGCKHVITLEHVKKMKDGAVLANAGHFDHEIDVKGLREAASSVRRVRPLFDEYTIDGKRVYLCGEGRLVNLANAEGHPSAVMAFSFCNQALVIAYGVAHGDELEPHVYEPPEEIDRRVARLQLEAMGVEIDVLTPEQQRYLNSWEEGT